MEALVFEWLNLILRWLHVITGIAWIGASFYFIWLDNNLETPPQWKKEKGVAGDLWAFHGGGIYEVGKYSLAPPTMPNNLHWFKWEAYSTWITGTLLLIVLYYFRADLYLVGPNNWVSSAPIAILLSIAFIFSGLLIYEALIRTIATQNTRIFLFLLCSLIVVACCLAPKLFSDRAAFLHVGALMASIMAANVFLGIIPAQKGFIKAIEAGKTPDKASMLAAKTRSVHNNYFTLPVLFCMISNHYSFLYGHDYNWLILVSIIAITAYARHFFNLKHKGVYKPSILVIAVIACLFLILAMYFYGHHKQAKTLSQVNTSTLETPEKTSPLKTLAEKHCQNCHSKTPTMPGFNAPPAGLVFESKEDFLLAKEKVLHSVGTQYMPLGNTSGMTEQERRIFLELVEQLK